MPTTSSTDPGTVVQRQLDAYNAHDLEALLSTYHPDKLLAKGREQFRERYAQRLAEPNLHATLLNRSVMGAVVVDYEEITRTFPEGPGTLRMVMIYEVRDGQIVKAWSIPGAKTLNIPPDGRPA